jgi:DNA-binding SARP family transcriptional activator
MDARCKIELLGGLRLRQGEQIITRFRTQKTAELLAYLAYFRQRTHPREILIELLWPEDEVNAGRHSLSVALSSLRPQLEPSGMVAEGSILLADRHAVGLNPAAVTTDVAEFEAALASTMQAVEEEERVRSLVAAVELYGGELLPGYYADWIFPEQQRLEEQFCQALRQLVLLLEQAGDLSRALQYALRFVSIDRLREEAHREVIRLYIASGQSAAALRQYRELERILQEELAVTPSAKTRALLDAITMGEPGSKALSSAGQARVAQPEPPAPLTIPLIRSDQLEPVGGAVPLQSSYYVVRPTDAEFHAAIARQDSVVLVKGPRQVGKTSLLARGLQRAREAGTRVVMTHFQVFNAAHLASAETLLLALAETIAEQLDLDVLPTQVWDTWRGPNPSFRRYLRREVLGKLAEPLVWGMDEVDRLFLCPFGSEIFGLFRSWHDERALEPGCPWERLTLAMAYSTEAHLFISDMNQSPFNIGTRLALEDFTYKQVADLNRRYGSPLREGEETTRYYDLVNGHPYLVRRGLHEMVAQGTSLATLEERACSDDWIFGEHLRRIAFLLTKDPELLDVVRAVHAGKPCPTRESFYRLRSAGVLIGESMHDARFRCPLYAAYLQQHLGWGARG